MSNQEFLTALLKLLKDDALEFEEEPFRGDPIVYLECVETTGKDLIEQNSAK